MDTLPDHPLEVIMRYALAFPHPSRVISTCQRFKRLTYDMCDGPPDDLSAYHRPYVNEWDIEIYNDSYPQHMNDYFLENLAKRDKAFLLRQCRKNHVFVIALVFGNHTRRCTIHAGILQVLIERNDFEMFQVLMRNFNSKLLTLSAANFARVYRDYKLDYRYLRELLIHNFRNGLDVERDACTGCRLAPYSTREWTIRAILENDDIELLHSYLSMRFIIKHNPHNPLGSAVCAGYSVQPQTLLQMYEHKSARIADYWQQSGRVREFPARIVTYWLERASDESIEFAARHGLDVSQTKTLRRAIRAKNVHLALTLLRAFSYKLTRQDRTHMVFHLRTISAVDASQEMHAELIARIHQSR